MRPDHVNPTLPWTEAHTNVLQAIQNMTAAFHAGDMEGVMSAYESQALVVFEPGKPVSDAAGLRAGFRGFFAVSPRFEYAGHEVFVAGDLALHLAPWTMTGTGPGGEPIRQSGLSVAVLRRQPDGSWRMVIDDPFGQHLMEQR